MGYICKMRRSETQGTLNRHSFSVHSLKPLSTTIPPTPSLCPHLLGRVVLGYFYPALASAKTAVQQDPAAFTQWMTYWYVVYVVRRLVHRSLFVLSLYFSLPLLAYS